MPEHHYWRVIVIYSDGKTSGNRVFKDRAKVETFAARQRSHQQSSGFDADFTPVSAALGLISGGTRNYRVSSSVSPSLSKYASFSGIPGKIAPN
jgi:hypothetical protein